MSNRKAGVNTFYKIVTVLILITLPIITRAQDLPCDGTDPYTTCPLDSWVVVLVIIAGLFGALHLRGRKIPIPTK
jgi:hypothetical protein